MRYGVVSADGRVKTVQDIDLAHPSLLHDIAITENHTILLDFPMRYDAAKLAAGKRRVSFDRDAPSRYGIIARAGGDIRWFEGPACYAYHTVNAWEEHTVDGTVIVMLACRIDDPIPRTPHEREPHIPRLTFLRLEPFLHEWRFNLSTGQMTERQLDDVRTEFPRMNDNLLGEKARFAYHPRVAEEPTLLFDAVVRYDLERSSSETYEFGADRFSSEVCFAPCRGATSEDDGWLVSLVNDRRHATSELVVLDARDITAGPVARVCIPRRVPVGFHAHWVAGHEIGAAI